jgi:thymidine kinase
MFSGKSTELTRRIRRHQMANRQCLVVKYVGDTRFEDPPSGGGDGGAGHDGGSGGTGTSMPTTPTLAGCVVTHDRQTLTAFPARALADVDNVAHAFDVIGIDEGQFFGDVLEFCEKWANQGKTVIVAALDGTFQRRPFNHVLGLVPLAEEVTKLSAVCTVCCETAAFTRRVGSADTTVEIIGGADMYTAVCRACFDVDSVPPAAAPAAAVTPAAATRVSAAGGGTPTRPPSSASSVERQKHKKRQSMEGASTPREAAGGAKSAGGSSASEVTPSLKRVGEQMRTLTMDSPSTPAMFSGFGSPIPGVSASASGSRGGGGEGRAAGKKAAGLSAAAAAASAGVSNVMMGGGKRLARGSGGPGRSPFSDLERRGMGAVVRSPLANVR